EVMPKVRQTSPPGEMFAYDNAGYAVLGRIVEVLREKPWSRVLRERLTGPLGLEHVATRADEAILFRAAVGHVQADPSDEPTPTKVWALPYSNAPAGAMLAMSARDLLGFARLHLTDGLAPDGSRLLSEAAAVEMRAPFTDVPRLTPRPTQRGLGWIRYDWDGGLVVGHDGQTIGQLAYLRVVPEQGVAVAVLTNGGRAGRLSTAITSEALRALAGIAVPPLPGVPPGPVGAVDRPERYVGRYEVHSGRVDVEVDDEGRLWMTNTELGELAELEEHSAEPERQLLVPLDPADGPDRFAVVEPVHGMHRWVAFLGSDEAGRARFLHTSRALPRV
ncbi:MAG TPA: serine hydrolase domain-containing protein, partial [Actinopolymorphaceae bacterium]